MDYAKYSKLRDERGYNDATVADKANVGKSAISAWKNGRTTSLSVENAQAIAKLFGVTLDELVREE